jgi:hypothetical protein
MVPATAVLPQSEVMQKKRCVLETDILHAMVEKTLDYPTLICAVR